MFFRFSPSLRLPTPSRFQRLLLAAGAGVLFAEAIVPPVALAEEASSPGAAATKATAPAGKRKLQLAPAHGSFVYYAAPGEPSTCSISSHTALRAEVLSESETHFEVRWVTPIAGCYLDRYFGNLSKKQGFVRKDDITWEEEASEDMPVVASLNTPGANAAVPPPPCPPDTIPNPTKVPDPTTTGSIPFASINEGNHPFGGIRNLLNALKHQSAGIKAPADIQQYLECYPYGDAGRDNYRRYKKFMELAGESFRVTINDNPIEVNPTLMACLFRRESGFDPKNTSHTDAVGLGQHTSINIKDMSQRLTRKGSWEYNLWQNFFQRAQADPEGKKLLAECPGSSKNGVPTFNTRDDAKCPLQSIAASHIYNLLIQRELMRGSRAKHIDWEQELNYQLAIGASYNLGNGAAREAVNNLFVGGWVEAITQKSSKKEKQKEVANHVTAIRNCMQAGNWEPMMPKDQPRCAPFPGRLVAGK